MGYRHYEIKALENVKEYKDDIKIFNMKFNDSNLRGIEGVSLNCHMLGIALPRVDTRDARSLMAGVAGRMGKKLPIPKNKDKFHVDIRATTRRWIRNRKISPISPVADTSRVAWLAQTHYPEWRKIELLKVAEEIDDLFKRNDRGELEHFKVKLFCKEESYVDFKHSRGIYAREDVAKLVFGPYFKLMETEIYKQPEFIKHVPVRDRAEYIVEMLHRDGGHYIATDYFL